MKKRNLILPLLIASCLAGSAAVSHAEEADASPVQTAAVLDRPEYKASDYVTLGEYKGLTVVKESGEITEETIDDAIAERLREADELQKSREGKVARNDIANIDFEGKIEGQTFVGGSASDYDLTIGSGSFIAGFENGLIGVTVGETKELRLKFPENYGNAELAGKDVVFTVKVNSIKKIPELSSEIVSRLSDGQISDPVKYREKVKEELSALKEEKADSHMKADLLTQVANTSEITGYPKEMIDYLEGNILAFYEKYAELYSMSMDDFLKEYMGLTRDTFEAQMKETAQQNLQQELYLLAIAEAEEIQVTEEELTSGCNAFAAAYGYVSAEKLKAEYGEDTIRVSLLQNKVLDFLLENAVVTDEEPETEKK